MDKCPHCNSENLGKLFCGDCGKAITDLKPPQFKGFKPFFSDAVGREIESKEERDRIGKEKGWIFGDDKDFVSEAAQNRKDIVEKRSKDFKDGLKEKLSEVI